MTLLINPVALRMVLLLLSAMTAVALGLSVSRRLRKNLAQESESLQRSPLAAEGMPVHAFQAVIQHLKQQKHELTARQLAERRKAKASDALSATVLANLSNGVLFFNRAGLVRQANPAARNLLGFASPIGLQLADLFRTATLRRPAENPGSASSVEQALAPALSGGSTVRGLLLNYVTRNGESRVLEVTASPALADDASLMGMAVILTDKTEIERVWHHLKMRREVSAELALGLRNSLAAIRGFARELEGNPDAELTRQLAGSIASEAGQLDRTIGSFLEAAQSADGGVLICCGPRERPTKG